MGRQKQPEIADALLDACTDFALAHGLPERLGVFAAGTGTSARMLVYHFETRDKLRRAVLHRARERQRAFFGQVLCLRADEPYLLTLHKAWDYITGDEGRPYLSMFGRLREDAAQQLWPGFARVATTDWLGPLEEGMASLGRRELGTLVLAVVRGLIMDLEATGDAARVDAAWAEFVQSLESLPGPHHMCDTLRR